MLSCGAKVVLCTVVVAAVMATAVSEECTHHYKSYEGQQVWRLHGLRDSVQRLMTHTQDRGDDLDVWSRGRDWVDVVVTEAHNFSEVLKIFHLEHSVVIKDLDSAVQTQRKSWCSSTAAEFSLEVYHTFEEIEAYLTSVAEADERVTLQSAGVTEENRDLWVLKISTDSSVSKPTVWIDCGIHAREWITPATCLWILSALLTKYGEDELVTRFLDVNNVQMMPVMNADGYSYSWSDDRMWRKNRHQFLEELCSGVDLNRNYNGTNWGGIGSSDSHCADTYHGFSPFSEAETSAVSDQLLALASSDEGLTASFSLHSYGALWLFAYGWTNALPEDADEMFRVANVGVDAIKSVNGNQYTPGPHYTTIYPSTGTVVDYGYEFVGMPRTYIIESEARGYGFLLPENLIAETAEEVWQGILAAVLAS